MNIDLQTLLQAVRTIGPGDALRTTLYAWRRDRLDRRYRARRAAGPLQPPGPLQEAAPLPGGARFRFAHSELEVLFLAPDLVRVTWEPGTPPLPYALARTDWPALEIELQPHGEQWHLPSSELDVIVQIDGGLRFTDLDGQTLRHELPPEHQAEAWSHRAHLRPEEQLHGLGERATPFNLRGRSHELWNRDPAMAYAPGDDPLYLNIPVYLGLHLEGSYLVFYENSHRATLTFGDNAEAFFAGGALRYYFIPGPPARALERYGELTGRPPLPPRWALGYHQSRWGYNSEAEVRDVAAGFRAHDLPLSAIHLDIDYMHGYRVFTVDPERFPDLAGLTEELAAQDIHLVAIVDPGIKRDRGYDLFREGLEKGLFCTLPGGRPSWALVWPSWCGFPDFTDPQARDWWGQHYPRLLQQGIAGFWHDMNEPAAFSAWGDMTLPLPTQHRLDGHGGDHAEAHNLYGLLMNQAGYEALRQHHPRRRPFILSRSGWAGLQRYAWNWTGDIESSWPALRQTVATVLGLGLSGIPYSGPDIGGFGGDPSAELYLRWFQLATFLPFFRTHSSWETARREPWAFGEAALSIIRQFLQLRCQLLPYLYTLAWQASLSGHPLVRPLFWPGADDPELWNVDDAFFLGEALLVAPILKEGIHSRELTLPTGRWYSFWDSTVLEGPGQVTVEASLEHIPVLVRAGSVLPLAESGRLALHIYPPADGEGTSLLYSDAGDGYGPGRLDRFHLRRTDNLLELRREGKGDFPFPYPRLKLCLHGVEPLRAWVDDMEIERPGPILKAGPFDRARIEIAASP